MLPRVRFRSCLNKTSRLPVFRLYGTETETYDLIVIGGGSGGLACAKEAAGFGKKVAVLDYVHPSQQGTKWGLGGTCVNVGCIPKKLMHQAALLGHGIQDAQKYGWDVPADCKHNWQTLRREVQNHVKSLNWGHRVQLKSKEVTYLNAVGSFVDKTSVLAVDAKRQKKFLEASNVVVAVGGRPYYPNIPGAKECAISSDDVFSLKDPPGKTLIIGGSYIALETAGFLHGLGFETTVMIRSVALRSFDQQMANLIVESMKSDGVNFLFKCKPVSFEKPDEETIIAKWEDEEGKTHSDKFNTVMLATGRTASTEKLQLNKAWVKTCDTSKRILTDKSDRTTNPNVYAIGDVANGRPELTPVAILAGKLLARRLAGNSKFLMDYNKVPTTVFTPLEYSTVGMSETDAVNVYGEDKIEVLHAFYKPLEYTVAERKAEQCYTKVICEREHPQQVLGIHFLGPNAGEVMQGFAAALRCGLTRSALELTVGIHPTCAEEIVKLRITKRSKEDPQVTGC